MMITTLTYIITSHFDQFCTGSTPHEGGLWISNSMQVWGCHLHHTLTFQVGCIVSTPHEVVQLQHSMKVSTTCTFMFLYVLHLVVYTCMYAEQSVACAGHSRHLSLLCHIANLSHSLSWASRAKPTSKQIQHRKPNACAGKGIAWQRHSSSVTAQHTTGHWLTITTGSKTVCCSML